MGTKSRVGMDFLSVQFSLLRDRNAMLASCRLILLSVLLSAALPATAQEQVPSPFQGIKQLSSDGSCDCIRMPVAFGQLVGDIMVDTGSAHSVVDSEYIGNCKDELALVSANDAFLHIARIRTFSEFPFRFQGAAMRLTPVGLVDLNGLQNAIGGPLVGVMGYDFLRSNMLSIGYESASERFFIANSAQHAEGDRVFSLIDSTSPLTDAVRLSAGLGTSKFLIDTGFNGAISLISKEFDQLEANGRLTHVRTTSKISLFGSKKSRRAVLDEIEVFGQNFHNVPVLEENGNVNKVGLAFLRKFDFTLQTTSNKLHIFDKPQLSERFLCDLSGVALLQKGTDICVKSVDSRLFPNSKVVQSGDIFREINGQVVSSLAQARLSLATYSSSPVRILIERERVRMVVDLALTNPNDLGL